MNEEINTVSEEQVLHNKLSFEINQELIHLMKRIVELQQENKKYKEVIDKIKINIENDIDGFRTINEFGESQAILELLDIYLGILKEVNK